MKESLRKEFYKLVKNKERFELMINNSTDIFVELTAQGEQLYISPVVEGKSKPRAKLFCQFSQTKEGDF